MFDDYVYFYVTTHLLHHFQNLRRRVQLYRETREIIDMILFYQPATTPTNTVLPTTRYTALSASRSMSRPSGDINPPSTKPSMIV